MNYGTAEQEIVDQLKAYISSIGKTLYYDVELMPETDFEFKEFYAKWKTARIAVQYIDSEYDPCKAIGIVVQDEKVRFRLTFEARKLRGDGGMYNIIEIAKLALIGFNLSNSDALKLTKYGMLEYEQGGWQPYLEFECKTINVQEYNNTEVQLGASLISVSGVLDFESLPPETFTSEFTNQQFN